jgi:intracellular multiplication protein IcmE
MAGFFKRLTGDKGNRRLLWVVGFVMLAIAGGYFFSRAPAQVNVSNLRPVPAQLPTTQGGAAVSPAYRQALNESDTQRAEEARQKGESAVPTIVLNPQTAASPSDPDRQSPRLPGNEPPRQEPVVVARPLTVPQLSPPPMAPPVVRQMNDMQVQQLAKSIGTMGDDRLAGAKVEYFNDGKFTTADAGDGSRQLAQIVSANSGQIVDPLKPFPGTVLYAEMVSEANSDAPGPVLARIEQGPLSGATLIGQFKAGQESLVIDFRKMTVVKNEGGRQIAKTIDIEAYAVNASTLSTAVATDVDRHLFQKIALTAATTFVQGLGNAVGQSGATVSRDQTGTTIAYPTLDTKQQLLVAGGQTAGQIGSIVQREFGNRPTTIKVRSGTPVGILFL